MKYVRVKEVDTLKDELKASHDAYKSLVDFLRAKHPAVLNEYVNGKLAQAIFGEGRIVR